MEKITQHLIQSSKGDKASFELLYRATYDSIRKMAEIQLSKESQNPSLNPTLLVNEAFLKLVDQNQVDWQNRSHFFALATQMMKRFVIDHVRSKKALKRGGDQDNLSFEEEFHSPCVLPLNDTLLDLDKALEKLKKLDPRKAQVIEMRIFAGLTIEEIAKLLETSTPTIKRDWAFARAFLERAMSEEKED